MPKTNSTLTTLRKAETMFRAKQNPTLPDRLRAEGEYLCDDIHEGYAAGLMFKAADEIERLQEYEWKYKELCK